MITHQDLPIARLNDAYRMESALMQVLEDHVTNANDRPQLQSKIQEHIGHPLSC